MIQKRIGYLQLLAAALLPSLLAPVAFADDIESPFVGIGYSANTYENVNNNASNAKPASVRLTAGSVVAKYLGVEAQLAVGAGDDDISVTTIAGTTTYKISSPLIYGLYARPQLPLGPITIYGLAGYSYAQLKYSPLPSGASLTKKNDDFSYGGGVQIDLGQHWGLSADYMQYVEGLKSINASVLYRF